MQRSIEEFLSQARVSDSVNLIYLSCHGVQDAAGKLYFAFSDTEKSYLRSTAVSADWVRDRINESRSRATVVLVDCCFSGVFIRGMRARSVAGPNLGALVQDLPQGSGVAILTASGEMEVSFEEEDPSAVSCSYFTAAVIAGISTGDADMNRDGRITVDELYEFVYGYVVNGPSPQRPRKLGMGEGSLVIANVAHSIEGSSFSSAQRSGGRAGDDSQSPFIAKQRNGVQPEQPRPHEPSATMSSPRVSGAETPTSFHGIVVSSGYSAPARHYPQVVPPVVGGPRPALGIPQPAAPGWRPPNSPHQFVSDPKSAGPRRGMWGRGPAIVGNVTLWVLAVFVGAIISAGSTETVAELIGYSKSTNPVWAALFALGFLGALLYLLVWLVSRRPMQGVYCLAISLAFPLLIQAIVLAADGFAWFGLPSILVWLAVLCGSVALFVRDVRSSRIQPHHDQPTF
ncbi:hypothetical protein GCM10009687_54560 [Asanoa iriomotensis]|uniref:Caspase domain-containing protein n=1 Tax=Asanoa iriomotensis TaxID=234613 RepID=A0ABQ4C5I3_9ACTN|nr:hypothetical protein Air01nite_41310 [Asanoa iriomotensis]